MGSPSFGCRGGQRELHSIALAKILRASAAYPVTGPTPHPGLHVSKLRRLGGATSTQHVTLIRGPFYCFQTTPPDATLQRESVNSSCTCLQACPLLTVSLCKSHVPNLSSSGVPSFRIHMVHNGNSRAKLEGLGSCICSHCFPGCTEVAKSSHSYKHSSPLPDPIQACLPSPTQGVALLIRLAFVSSFFF